MDVVNLDDAIWQYCNLDIDVDSILIDVESGKYKWEDYTNGLRPDGTDDGSTIKGKTTYLNSEINFYKDILKVFIDCFNDYLINHNENISMDNLDINIFSKTVLDDRCPLYIRKYLPGSILKSHSDAILNLYGGGYTALFYYNDNFEGGELMFKEKNIIVKPKKASLLIFPYKYEHEVLLLKSGNRYLSSAYLFRESYKKREK